jgi:hypothetical protein
LDWQKLQLNGVGLLYLPFHAGLNHSNERGLYGLMSTRSAVRVLCEELCSGVVIRVSNKSVFQTGSGTNSHLHRLDHRICGRGGGIVYLASHHAIRYKNFICTFLILFR